MPNGLSTGCRAFLLQVDEAEIVMHEAYDPDTVVDLLDADPPAGQYRAQVDLAPLREADAAALGDREGSSWNALKDDGRWSMIVGVSFEL